MYIYKITKQSVYPKKKICLLDTEDMDASRYPDDPLILLLPNSFKLLVFLIFRSLAYLLNVIPETRRAH
jgi:hypothetical protein